MPSGLTTAVSLKDKAISKETHGQKTTASIISNEEMEDILKIVKALQEPGFIIKGANGTTENEVKR